MTNSHIATRVKPLSGDNTPQPLALRNITHFLTWSHIFAAAFLCYYYYYLSSDFSFSLLHLTEYLCAVDKARLVRIYH